MNFLDALNIGSAVIASVGTSAVLIFGLSGWLGKVWADRLMQGAVAKHNQDLERIKSDLKKLEAEHNIRFARLHDKRADVISTLYEKLYDFNGALHRLLFAYQGREIREDIDRQFYLKKRESWDLVQGIHTLSEEEAATVEHLSSCVKDIYAYYGANRLYVPIGCCVLMDRFNNLAGYVAVNYSNVALKDNDGNLLVHPDVKRIWDGAITTIPALMTELESVFRQTLGEKIENEA